MFPARRLLLLLPLIALLSSCSEDFEVAAPYKPITVVYGILNVGDTAHYIRIQKAFLDEQKSAIDMAKTADSNFYANLSVHLKEISNGTVRGDEELQRVDLNAEGYPKEPGAFFDAPNYAYKSRRVLNPDYSYRLVITNPATGTVDSAETPIIDNKPGAPPRGFFVYEFNTTFSLNFAVQQETNKFGILVQTPQHSQIYEGFIRFHYVNRDASGGEQRDSVDWLFANNVRDQSRPAVELSTLQRSFYYFLRDAIGTAPPNVSRYMDSADMYVWAGSAEMELYRKINGAQGGITADQIKPLYTNIKSNMGNNALGLFTTRAKTQFRNIGIDQRSLDSLMTSSITKNLNIRGRTTR